MYYVQNPSRCSSRNYGYELGFLTAMIQKEGNVSDKLAKMCRRLAMCYLNSDEPEKAQLLLILAGYSLEPALVPAFLCEEFKCPCIHRYQGSDFAFVCRKR